MEGYYSPDSPCVAWLDDNGMLCYMEGSTLHKYDTRGQGSLSDDEDGDEEEDENDDQSGSDEDDNESEGNEEDSEDDDEKEEEEEEKENIILQWEQQVDLPMTPSLSGCRWPNIHGGYRPTLLPPLTLQPQDDVNDGNRYQLEHAMLSALYGAMSKPNTSRQPQLMMDHTK
jgi:hypothetical protein